MILTFLLLAACSPTATLPDGGWELVEIRVPGEEPLAPTDDPGLVTAFPEVRFRDLDPPLVTSATVLPAVDWPEDCPTQWSASRLETWRLADPVEVAPGEVLDDPHLVAACDGDDGPATQAWLMDGPPPSFSPCTETTCRVFQLPLD